MKLKKLFSVMLCGAMMASFTACEKEEEGGYCEIRLQTSSDWEEEQEYCGLYGATATLSKFSGIHEGEEVILTITPNSGYKWVETPMVTIKDNYSDNKSYESQENDGVYTYTIRIDDYSTDIYVKGRATELIEGHEYVDLGLSSGLLWATCNVGASKPHALGYKFAWGETSPKDEYDWSNYVYSSGYNDDELTKYCTDAKYGKDGFTDNKTVLDFEDDAARVNWGGNWRMPTKSEFDELIAECEWVYNYGDGYTVTGPNGNSIFLPADGTYSYYWSSSLRTSDPQFACILEFYSSSYETGFRLRCNGVLVRAVCEK